MKLEEEIMQTKPFKSELQKLVLNINFTSSWLNSMASEMLKVFDVTAPQYNVLRILKGRYPKTYCNQEITARMIDKNSNATRIVDKLISKGLAQRSENKSDRRAVEIIITEKGINLLQTIDESEFGHIDKRLKVNEENAKLMNDWLDQLRG